MNVFIDSVLELGVRFAFAAKRRVEYYWAICVADEKEEASASLTPMELEARAIEEAFEMRRRATFKAAAAGVVRARHERGERENNHHAER